MSEEKRTTAIHVRLPTLLVKELDTAAAKIGETRGGLAAFILKQWLSQQRGGKSR